jgi:zeta-carotene desaturase
VTLSARNPESERHKPKSANSPRQSSFDAVVIGGGLSGLAAAVELASRGGKVALFEQAPRLGGRCYSYLDEKTGDVVDNGQHILLGAYHNLIRYLTTIGTIQFLKTQSRLSLPFHHPSKGHGMFEIPSLPKPFHLTTGMLKFKLLPFRDRQKLLRIGLALNRWDQQMEKALSALTVEEWLGGLHQSEEARKCFWYPIAISVMNEVPEKACALLFARSLRAAFLGKKSDSVMLIPTVGQTELYVTGAETFLRLRGTELRLNTEVESIEISGSTSAGVRLKSGERIQAKHVISTVPYHSLLKLIPQKFRRERPFADLSAFESSPIISMHLWFDREFMDEDFLGLIGKEIQWVFNRRKFMTSGGEGTGYLSCIVSGARSLVDFTKEKLVALALRDIHAVYPSSRNAKITSSIVIKEKRATFSPTCQIEPLRPSCETPIDNLYLAGDWTNTGLPATIEGAVMSGFAVSRLVRK